MSRFAPPPPELVARVRAEAERGLDRAEWEAASAIPTSDDERREALDLVAWFVRRYPTAAERMAWSRRQYLAASRRAPPSAKDEGGRAGR